MPKPPQIEEDGIEILEVVGVDETTGTVPQEGEAGLESGAAPTSPAESGEASRAPAVAGDPLKAAIAEKDRIYDLLLRKAAELDNFRKRVEKDRLEVRIALTAELVRRMLPALDNLHRALPGSEACSDPLRQGILMVQQQVLEALRQEGVVPMEVLGGRFDPQLHEAVEVRDVDGFEQGVILEEMQRGYTIHGRLLRPALVKVASGRKGGGAGDPHPGGGA